MGPATAVWSMRKARPSDFPDTAAVLARAFADNPCYAFMHPRAATRACDLERFFLRNLTWHEPLDLTWIVAGDDAKVAGTVTLEPPGGIQRPIAEGLAHWVVPTLREQGFRTVARIMRTDAEFKRRYGAMLGEVGYWHVHAVAIAPDQHRRGAATAMLDAVFREAEELLRAKPAPVVLSTQREQNLALYRRFGLALVETARMRAHRAGRPVHAVLHALLVRDHSHHGRQPSPRHSGRGSGPQVAGEEHDVQVLHGILRIRVSAEHVLRCPDQLRVECAADVAYGSLVAADGALDQAVDVLGLRVVGGKRGGELRLRILIHLVFGIHDCVSLFGIECVVCMFGLKALPSRAPRTMRGTRERSWLRGVLLTA
jgi:ribosomal protein S18 acetylase RimI-like enzyme